MEAVLDYLHSTTIYKISLFNWGISLLILLFTFIFVRLLLWLFFKIIALVTKNSKINIHDSILASLRAPLTFLIATTGICWALFRLHIMPKMDKILQNVYQIAIILGITWIVVNVLNGVIRKVLSSHPERSAKIDDNVIHILTRTVSGIIWALGVVMALSNVGINVGGIIAGLGIGGVAFALASQDTIKNIFAGVVIFIDRPFRLGDNIRIDSNTGIVEDIGLRSVRIRTPDKKLVIISSSKAIDSVIENISQEPARRITLLLGLTYDTTPEKMNLALSLLRDLPTSIRAIKGSTPYFTNYGDSALTITFIYFIRKGEDIMETQSKVNLAILTQFNENKLNFAFPTQTIYIEKADS